MLGVKVKDEKNKYSYNANTNILKYTWLYYFETHSVGLGHTSHAIEVEQLIIFLRGLKKTDP